MNLQENIHRIKGLIEQTDLGLKGRTIALQVAPPKNFGQSNTKVNITIDDQVDLLSAGLEGIPGIGNLVSFVIDEVHALSYFIRAATGSESDRTYNIIMGILTASLAFIPIGGNAATLASRSGISTILKQTPESIQKWAMNNGIINYRVLLGKDRFKYSFLLLFIRIFKDKGVDFIASTIVNLKQTIIKAKSTLLNKKLLTPQLGGIFDMVISVLGGYTSGEIVVAKQMIDKGFI
jgi:hypothetical protein